MKGEESASHALFAAGMTVLLFFPASGRTQTQLQAPEVEVLGHYELGLGSSDSASAGTVTSKRVESRPVSRTGEILEFVPGVIVTQHSGDGKANQYFVRGFNLDHGTDFAISVDGMPVNMRTHGHGQGYADLNFLIPELISRINYRKGPYFAVDGDFASAGAADIALLDAVGGTLGSLTLGQFDYQRAMLAGSPELADGRLLYAFEYSDYDGPWTNPNEHGKLNAVLRFTRGSSARGIHLTAMAYDADWTATDQIARRAVDQGLIDRFGTLDPTDGGESYRYSLSGSAFDQLEGWGWRTEAYLIRYKLNLWSNFTYFLDDPINGDQFEQADSRTVVGLNPSASFDHSLLGSRSTTTVGLQLRHDDIGNVALYRTAARERIGTVREDKVRESSAGLFGELFTQWTDWFRTTAGMRADFYRFDVESSIPVNSGSLNDAIYSPKLSAVFGPWARTEYFVNYGYGFHSNDARGTVITVDPNAPLTPAEPVTPLVKTRGAEVGVKTEAIAGLQSTLALWQLELDSELLFIGDAGTTEASRPSVRRGVEWSNHWIVKPWLLLDLDVSFSRARFRDEDPAGDYIPGSIERVVSGGVSVADVGPWSASVIVRYFGSRPLIADNSVRSSSTMLTNLRAGYRIDKRWNVILDVFNLFDREASDIEYFYESQLAGEPGPVEDIHFHPVEPRNVRLTLSGRF
jgi:outer membrane receptor protein involved in Fe transport